MKASTLRSKPHIAPATKAAEKIREIVNKYGWQPGEREELHNIRAEASASHELDERNRARKWETLKPTILEAGVLLSGRDCKSSAKRSRPRGYSDCASS